LLSARLPAHDAGGRQVRLVSCKELRVINSVFVEVRFWLLVVISFATPAAIYALLMRRASITRSAVFGLGVLLVMISAVDVYLLHALNALAQHSPSHIDDVVFSSELTIALYAFPVLYGGVGVNVVSHLLVDHLLKAERLSDRQHDASEAVRLARRRADGETPGRHRDAEAKEMS